MQVLIDFFKSFSDIISTLVDFVIGLFEDLVYMVKLLGQVVMNIPAYFSWLPNSVLMLIVTLIGVVVVYKILGREG